MLKISAAGNTGKSHTLKLEGRVIGPWVTELQSVCAPLVGGPARLRLDLADVTYTDPEGASLLAALEAQGVLLVNGTPFVNEQLKAGKTD